MFGCHPKLYSVLSVPHQYHHPVCIFPPTQHYPSPPSFTPHNTALLLHSLVTSQISLTNPFINVNGFRSSVCFITRSPSYRHITPTLYTPHWLPVKLHIDFKTFLYTLKAIHNLTPPYLSDIFYVSTLSWSHGSTPSLHLHFTCYTGKQGMLIC